MTDATALRQWDNDHVWHPFAPMRAFRAEGAPIIADADGFFLVDVEGNRYLDGVSSLWCNVHGHRVPEIDAAIRAQLDRVAHSTMLGMSNVPAIELAKRLVDLVPPGLNKVFYSDSGSTAVEVALKIAYQYHRQKRGAGFPACRTGQTRMSAPLERDLFVCLGDAYHGDTIGSVSVGGMPLFHDVYDRLLFKTIKVPPPTAFRAKEVTSDELRVTSQTEVTSYELRVTSEELDSPNSSLVTRHSSLPEANSSLVTRHSSLPEAHSSLPEAVIAHRIAEMERIVVENANRIAAFVIEPLVQGAAGMLVHPPGYLKRVREVTAAHGIPLIADEVAVGFGRTGTMFACEQEQVVPDLLCVAKGLTGGYLPVAATLATDEIFDAFLGEPHEGRTFYHGHTFTGNPLGCAAALASLDLFEKNDVLANVRANAERLAKNLAPLADHPHVGEIRQKGIMVGIELVRDRAANTPFPPEMRIGHQVTLTARRRGVALRPLGDVIVLMPAPAMPADLIDRLCETVSEAIDEGTRR